MTINPIKIVLQRQDRSKLSQYLAAICASIVGFTSGIHLGWPAPSLSKILSPEYPFEINEEEASYIVIISCLGHVIGGILAATLIDLIGRKKTLLSIAIPQILALIMISTSYQSKYLLYSARILGGIGEGATLATLPSYVAEVSEPQIRGILGTFIAFIFTFGMLYVNLVGSYLDIYSTALISLVFPVLFCVLFVNFPETPYYYLMNKNTEKATDSLKILRRRNSVCKEVDSLAADVDRQMSESGSYKDLFTIPTNRKAFCLVSITRFFQQFTGCSAFGLYSQLLVQEATNLSPILGSSLLIIVQLVVICLSSLIVDKFGRRPLFILSAAFTTFVLFVQGTFATINTYSSLDLSHWQWFPLLVMVCFIIVFTMGLGIGLNIFGSEMYSSSIRSKAYSLGSIVLASTMMASTKYYQFTADNFGLAVPFYSFAVCSLVGTIFFYFKLPETKGKTLETIQQELKGKPKKEKQLYDRC